MARPIVRSGGREARIKARTAAAPVYLPAVNRQVGPINLLGPDGVQKIHRGAMRILWDIGIVFRDARALSHWKQAGARVDGERVHIPEELIMELMSSVPPRYTFHARNPARSVQVGDNFSIFANCYGSPFVYGLDGVRRRSELADTKNFLRLAQMSQAMHISGILPAEPQDVPVPQRHLDLVSSALKLADKPIMGSVISEAAAQDTIDMLRIVFGEEFVDRNVVVTALLNCNTPLVWDETMLDALRIYAAANQPALLTPFLLAGASGPASPFGGVALLVAEALAGMAYAQIVRRGCPMVMGVALMGVSMKTGAPMLGTAEPGLMNLLVGQMARHYNVPWRSCTMWTGSKMADIQAGYDSANSMWPVMLGGCNFIMHSAGFVEGALGVSYSKWVQDSYQLEGYHRFFSGLADEALEPFLSDIQSVGPGGHFLGTDHTRENPFSMNPLQNNDSYEKWLDDGAKSGEQVGVEEAKRQLDAYIEPSLDEDLSDALDEFVAAKRRVYAAAA
ncbi:trimethylamine methyltransferase family protein [Mesorhizobium sp. VK22B]|uniref:Methyltransferase n=1 Tax=Mesorhizobium captivum TaxID=3072319 RepID=A0ABU4ZAG3_9HYPH|nr:trimethylamine methyltransferase family protein [Mesorhizobium sp. VK22B]MDX8496258.1 trimethylamine methyltransferase family protein [Mesorhizobium sp. VK22B]